MKKTGMPLLSAGSYFQVGMLVIMLAAGVGLSIGAHFFPEHIKDGAMIGLDYRILLTALLAMVIAHIAFWRVCELGWRSEPKKKSSPDSTRTD